MQRLIDVGAPMSHDYRLDRLCARFHNATLVVWPGFGTVVIAQMDLDAGHLPLEVAHRVLHDSAYVLGHALASVDVVIGVDLNLHVRFSPVGACLLGERLVTAIDSS